MKDSDLFEYEKMVERALRGVVREALQQVYDHGLHGEHHFYITFQTDYPGIKMPPYLLEKYPDEMTIVLQYQFDKLKITPDRFEVSLSFNNVPEQMVIPFDAITGFADPSVKFGLQFHVSMADLDELDIQDLEDFLDDEDDGDTLPAAKPAKAPKTKGGEQDNVVSLDHFRKT